MNPILDAVAAELKYYPGVQMDKTDRGGNNRKITFSKGGHSRFLVVPRGNPGDWRAGQNALRDFRKTMSELGATRLNETPRRKSKRPGRRGSTVFISLNEKNLSLTFHRRSDLLSRVKTKDAKATGAWEFSLRPSVDLTAPPLVVIKRHDLPDGKIHPGWVRGFHQPNTGGWRLTISRGQVAALHKLAPLIRSTPVRLYEDNGDELVFQLPPETMPTGFSRPVEVPANGSAALVPDEREALAGLGRVEGDRVILEPDADLAAPPSAAEIARTEAARHSLATGLQDKPIVLQFPKQAISIEAAVLVLNKAKRRLGNGLRFTIEEGGYLSAVHKISH